MSHRRVLSLATLLASALLAGCGAHPATAPVLHAGSVPAALASGATKVIDGPVVASAVLAYGHATARALDPKASFTCLLGTHIDETGAPATGGSWELDYVGDNVPAPAGAAVNPYMPYVRRIAITVSAQGKARVKVSAQQGLPLGVAYLDAPMPAIDSPDAFKLFYQLRLDIPRAPVAQMMLSGMVSAHHFDRLAWHVLASANDETETPTLLDAMTGAAIGTRDDLPAR